MASGPDDSYEAALLAMAREINALAGQERREALLEYHRSAWWDRQNVLLGEEIGPVTLEAHELWESLTEEERYDRASNVVPLHAGDERRWDTDEGPEPLSLIDPASWAGTEPPHRRWKVKDYIPDGQATLLTGKGAAGKSLVSQLKTTCIGLGLPFLGLEVAQTNALYITCEDDADELQRRQAAICEGLGVDISSLSGKVFLLSLHGLLGNELATFTVDGRMSVASRYEQIVDACKTNGIGYLVLDNTAHLFTGNENDRHQVAAFIGLCNRLAIEIGGAVVLVGHPNKAGDSYSGSTAWENQVRSRLFMEIPTSEDGALVDPDMRVMRREKVNYAQRGGELQFRWHKGTFVLPDDLPEPSNELAQTASDARDNGLFLNCLRERLKQRRAVSENVSSRTYAPKVFADMAESKGIGRARLERALDRLYRIDAVGRGFLWVNRGEGKPVHGLLIKSEKIAADASEGGSDDVSDDINVNSGNAGEVIGKPNKINPMTSPMTSEGDVIGNFGKKPGKPSDDLSDDVPMTSDDVSDDVPPSLREGIGASPSTRGGGSLPTRGSDVWRDNPILNPEATLEPPPWMDEAPPWDEQP